MVVKNISYNEAKENIKNISTIKEQQLIPNEQLKNLRKNRRNWFATNWIKLHQLKRFENK